MSQKEFDVYKEYMQKKIEEVSNSREAAEKFLKSVGVLTRKGNISKKYKGLTRVVPR